MHLQLTYKAHIFVHIFWFQSHYFYLILMIILQKIEMRYTPLMQQINSQQELLIEKLITNLFLF